MVNRLHGLLQHRRGFASDSLASFDLYRFIGAGIQRLPHLRLANGKRTETRQRRAPTLLQLLDDRSQQFAGSLTCDRASALGSVLDDTRDKSLLIDPDWLLWRCASVRQLRD
jgi:hypothetical protein